MLLKKRIFVLFSHTDNIAARDVEKMRLMTMILIMLEIRDSQNLALDFVQVTREFELTEFE